MKKTYSRWKGKNKPFRRNRTCQSYVLLPGDVSFTYVVMDQHRLHLMALDEVIKAGDCCGETSFGGELHQAQLRLDIFTLLTSGERMPTHSLSVTTTSILGFFLGE
jgi:hypothetical protein